MAGNKSPSLNIDFWLFGYGSLIWKPPPHYDQRVPGYVHGYVRRFWQASQDHRGTPESPGRVVTLIERSFWATLGDVEHENTPEKVWGAAYHIVPEKVEEVQEYLDIREINGYSIQFTTLQPADPGRMPIRCMVYIGMPDNSQFLGALNPQDVAEKINESIGPSGENREYLLQLDESLKHLSPEAGDPHVSGLAQKINAMTPPVRTAVKRELPALQRSSSIEEQEEI